MAKPIEIRFIADVANYLRDVKKVEVSTDDIAEAMVALSTDSKDLERKLSKAMRDAAKDVDTLERAIDGVGDTTRRVGDQAKGDFRKVGKAGGDAGKEVGDEFRQNLGESLSSGNFQDLIGDSIGGLVAGLKSGPALVAAASAGLAYAVWGKMQEEQRKAEEGIGRFFEAWDKQARDRATYELIGDGDKQKGIQRIGELAKEAGLTTKEVFNGIAGDNQALIDDLAGEYEALNRREAAGIATRGDATDALTEKEQLRKKAIAEILGLEEKNTEQQGAALELQGIELDILNKAKGLEEQRAGLIAQRNTAAAAGDADRVAALDGEIAKVDELIALEGLKKDAVRLGNEKLLDAIAKYEEMGTNSGYTLQKLQDMNAALDLTPGKVGTLNDKKIVTFKDAQTELDIINQRLVDIGKTPITVRLTPVWGTARNNPYAQSNGLPRSPFSPLRGSS